MPVLWRFEGFECGTNFFTKRIYVRDIGNGRKVYPTSPMVQRFGLLISLIQTEFPMMLQEHLVEYVTLRFIATAQHPDSFAASMFVTGDPELMLQAAALAVTGSGPQV